MESVLHSGKLQWLLVYDYLNGLRIILVYLRNDQGEQIRLLLIGYTGCIIKLIDAYFIQCIVYAIIIM